MPYLSWETAETLENAGFLLFGKQGRLLHTQEVTGSSPAVSTKNTGNSDEFPVFLFDFAMFLGAYSFRAFLLFPLTKGIPQTGKLPRKRELSIFDLALGPFPGGVSCGQAQQEMGNGYLLGAAFTVT